MFNFPNFLIFMFSNTSSKIQLNRDLNFVFILHVRKVQIASTDLLIYENNIFPNVCQLSMIIDLYISECVEFDFLTHERSYGKIRRDCLQLYLTNRVYGFTLR